ncbi:Mlp family lipoprotein (plasmid) [Borrelia coriaceae]|nr:Mlp family lipoprotein [Borrelia coriaceae]
MSKINVVLILLLLVNSCNKYDFTNNTEESKSRGKREISEEQTREIKKTPKEILREKLNEEEKANLDFLKESLGDDFDKFLGHDATKIKSVLEHVKGQLERCNGKDSAEEQKKTFRVVLQGSFKGNSHDLDKFTSEAMGCIW